MEIQDQVIEEEMRKLIKKSCATKEALSKYNTFHTSFLKFYFNALDVSINYDEQLISLWNSRPISEEADKLFDINEAVGAKVSYSNLEETLKGCLEKGSIQTRFYKSILFTYNNVNGEDDWDNAISA